MHVVSSACRAVLEPDENSEKFNDSASTLRKRNSNCDTENIQISDFSAKKFVDNLLYKGCNVTCDETSRNFNENMDLPPYYNEIMFKKPEVFLQTPVWTFFSKLLGLIMLLALPTVKVLIMTNKSSTPLTSYKRYLATIFHMCVWYDDDFKPGSKLWSSIGKVRSMHNSASKQSSIELNYRINQRDMALTQFGFMGFGIVRSKMVGIHNATEDELKNFIHLWRVVGYVLGIEDRFNICRESVKETKEICSLLIDRVFCPSMNEPTEDFNKMSKVLIEGMWVMNPFLQHDVFVCYLYMTLENTNHANLSKEQFKLTNSQSKSKLNAIILIMWSLQFTVVRVFYKYLQIMTLWLMRVFPFLAYYRFRGQNSRVTI